MFSILLMPILVFAGPIAEMQALGQNPAIYKKWAVYNKKCKSTIAYNTRRISRTATKTF